MKFKVGDKVRIKNNLKQGHEYSIYVAKGMEKYAGKIMTIRKIEGEKYKMEEDRKEYFNDGWYWTKEMFEDQFTKSNLQNGDIVVCRNGQTRMVMCNKLMNEDGIVTNYLTKYEEDLRYKVDSQKDIIRVERPVKYETVFERKEEILDEVEKRYLASVIRPFRDEVEYIVKNQNIDGEFIHIELDGDSLNFPYLRDETMYKRMKPDKRYTLEELGL